MAIQILFHLVLVSISCVFQGIRPYHGRSQIFGLKLFVIFPFTLLMSVRTVMIILLSAPPVVK